ncbi:energy transducer TonB [Emcibacter sp. SYSU 3D8]|uniref:energy transducer TonB n=1 Tax=Emcibacter sp. SYSU 3D8 TaxID=3133969 RepID=UPI0031FE674D
MNNTQSVISGRALGFGFVILIHVGIFYALMSGLSSTMVELLTGPMETEIIDEAVKDDSPPPPPPPDFKPPPPAFVDMPMVAFDSAPATRAIQNVTNEVKKAPPPPPPPVAKPTEPRQDPRRPITQPEYPSTSVRLGEEGAVILKFMVMPNGRVDADSISVVESSGSDRLDKAAMTEARKAWRFIPGTKDGKPVAVWHQFRVVFELKKARR